VKLNKLITALRTGLENKKYQNEEYITTKLQGSNPKISASMLNFTRVTTVIELAE